MYILYIYIYICIQVYIQIHASIGKERERERERHLGGQHGEERALFAARGARFAPIYMYINEYIYVYIFYIYIHIIYIYIYIHVYITDIQLGVYIEREAPRGAGGARQHGEERALFAARFASRCAVCFRVQDSGFGVWGSGFRVWGAGFRVWGSGLGFGF